MVIREYDANWHIHPPIEFVWKGQPGSGQWIEYAVFRQWQYLASALRLSLGSSGLPTRAGPEERTWQHHIRPSAFLSLPLFHRHGCSPARLGSDLKFVHQTAHAR